MKKIIRYLINGLVATTLHYSVFMFNIHELEITSVGIANMIASIFGISISFIGNRYYVFHKHKQNIYDQARKFLTLYILIALLHGAILYVWSDIHKFNYNFGFIIATTLQVLLGYLGNKRLIFKF
jgi:putative flippase GtrA